MSPLSIVPSLVVHKYIKSEPVLEPDPEIPTVVFTQSIIPEDAATAVGSTRSSLIVTVASSVQPFESVTVTVYVPLIFVEIVAYTYEILQNLYRKVWNQVHTQKYTYFRKCASSFLQIMRFSCVSGNFQL